MTKKFVPNEVYTDLETPWERRVAQHKKPSKSQLEMWIDIIQHIKQGMLAGNISLKTLQSKYKIEKR